MNSYGGLIVFPLLQVALTFLAHFLIVNIFLFFVLKWMRCLSMRLENHFVFVFNGHFTQNPNSQLFVTGFVAPYLHQMCFIAASTFSLLCIFSIKVFFFWVAVIPVLLYCIVSVRLDYVLQKESSKHHQPSTHNYLWSKLCQQDPWGFISLIRAT